MTKYVKVKPLSEKVNMGVKPSVTTKYAVNPGKKEETPSCFRGSAEKENFQSKLC